MIYFNFDSNYVDQILDSSAVVTDKLTPKREQKEDDFPDQVDYIEFRAKQYRDAASFKYTVLTDI